MKQQKELFEKVVMLSRQAGITELVLALLAEMQEKKTNVLSIVDIDKIAMKLKQKL